MTETSTCGSETRQHHLKRAKSRHYNKSKSEVFRGEDGVKEKLTK